MLCCLARSARGFEVYGATAPSDVVHIELLSPAPAGLAQAAGDKFAANLLKLGNTIIVTGRDRDKLEEAQRRLPAIHPIQSDVSDAKEIRLLYDVVITKFPELNVLINNPGIMRKINLRDAANGLEDISRELRRILSGRYAWWNNFCCFRKRRSLPPL
jgi:uncharacterized oxidoreductase